MVDEDDEDDFAVLILVGQGEDCLPRRESKPTVTFGISGYINKIQGDQESVYREYEEGLSCPTGEEDRQVWRGVCGCRGGLL